MSLIRPETRGKRISLTRGDRVFTACNTVLMCLIIIVILYPLYFILIASVTDPYVVNSGRLLLYPQKLYLRGYQKIFEYRPLWSGYRWSLIYTLLGTLINVLVTVPAGYSLSRKDLVGRNAMMFLFTFTMFFSGGLIPLYLLVSNIKILNTPWALTLPVAVSVWNLIITRTFFQTNIPDEMLEAAVIDGCSNFRFFFSIVLPLSKVILSVITLFYAVNHWNGYFYALIYLSDDRRYPLQLILRNLLIINTIGNSSMAGDSIGMADRMRLAEQLKYGIIVVSSVPLLIVYPFLQKYFAQGVMIGAIKG